MKDIPTPETDAFYAGEYSPDIPPEIFEASVGKEKRFAESLEKRLAIALAGRIEGGEMKLEEMSHECSSCRNSFMQPFVCTTCGAQKLYDATLATVAAQRDEANQKLALAVAALKDIRTADDDCVCDSEYSANTVAIETLAQIESK